MSAWQILRGTTNMGTSRALRAAVVAAAAAIPFQIFVGDLHGLNTLEHQPQKVAAMEGVWETKRGAPLLLFAWPNEETRSNDYEIAIPKLYKSVTPPSKLELKQWKKLPFDKQEYLEKEVTAQTLTGLREYSVFERTWALPTLEIHGIRGGFTGEGAKTVIPARAMAKVSMRLVPNQDPKVIGTLFEEYMKKLAPKSVVAKT